MAGKRQHYLPRFLQRGFIVDPQEARERTWLHRRGTKAKAVSIRDVGVSEYFYSKLAADGAFALDDLITSLEGGLDSELSKIRRARSETLLDAKTAAYLTAHLALRTAHVRSVFAQSTALLIDSFVEMVSDANHLREVLDVDGTGISQLRSILVDEARRALPLADLVPEPFMNRLIAYLLREGFDAFYADHGKAMVQAMAPLAAGVSKMVRDAHNKSLSALDHSHWEDRLAQLDWRPYSVVGAILPDCVALVRESGGSVTPLTLRDGGRMDLVILPIAHDRLLVGSRFPSPDIDIAWINRASASCSDDFFISREARGVEELSDLIGQRCSQTINAVVAEAINDLRPRESSNTGAPQGAAQVVAPQASGPFSFSMICKDFGDVETAERLGRIVQVVVEQVARFMPLSQLDGITFAADYPAALAQLDRGDAALAPEASDPRAYGRAVAMCVDVVRASERKTHIVYEAGIALGLLHHDADVHALALHTLTAMLAQAAYGSLYQVRQESSGVPIDSVEASLRGATSRAPVRYFAARVSAFSDPKSGETYAELTMDCLSRAMAATDAARLRYRTDDNLDELLNVALRQFSFVFEHAAQWLGHRDGLPEDEPFPGSSLPSDLKTLGLHKWLELLGRDLRALHGGDGLLSNAKLLALSRHIERLLWTVNICPWPTDDGRMYVSVPIGADELRLDS
jgi:hypothetical protein